MTDNKQVCSLCAGRKVVSEQTSEYVWDSQQNLLEQKTIHISVICPNCNGTGYTREG